MAVSPEEIRSLYQLAGSFTHVNAGARSTTYEAAVAPVQSFSRAYFFSKASTAIGATTLELTLPLVGAHSSFHLLQYTGAAGHVLELQPNATDRVNSGALGVLKSYTSQGHPMKLLVFAVRNVWHVYSVGEDPIDLTAGTGSAITGTYPALTVTNTDPDQVVTLTGDANIIVGGAYPAFTLSYMA